MKSQRRYSCDVLVRVKDGSGRLATFKAERLIAIDVLAKGVSHAMDIAVDVINDLYDDPTAVSVEVVGVKRCDKVYQDR